MNYDIILFNQETKRGVILEQFDVIIVGSDLTSLASALFLARKMRNVLVVQEDKHKDDSSESISITDPENHKFHFDYQRENQINGIAPNSLLTKYLEVIGLDRELSTEKYQMDMVIEDETVIRERILSFEQFRVYLVRYYPKQRDQIHRFFKDLERHYQNFVTQYLGMLSNTDYTLTSLMIEWGDYSLEDLLEKYFQDHDLIHEFILNNQVNGLNPQEINSYNFFMSFFLGLKDGIVYLHQSNEDLRKILIKKLLILNPNIIQNLKIQKFAVDEDKKVSGFVDANGVEYHAKYFLINHNPRLFYEKHFPEFIDRIDTICKYYPQLNSSQRINTLYIALNQKVQNCGITELAYYFKNDLESHKRLIRLFNYKLFDPDACLAPLGALCVDFTYDDSDPFNEDEILKRIYSVFPKLKKSIVGMKLGKPKPYLSMLSDESVRKGLSINDQIAIESGEHIQLFDNLYLAGKWMRPEASLFGLIHSGVVLGDKIEEKLYYGEDDDTFYYLTNDEIMMMIRHNYRKILLGSQEFHVNFHIGKSNYFVRTKKKTITIHHGEYNLPDLSIYTTNDKLSNLLLKKTTFEEVLKTGGFKYQGNTENLYRVVNAFGLDDYQEYVNVEGYKPRYHFIGIKFLFAYLTIYGVLAFLSNYINSIWLVPFALGITAGLTYLKYRLLHSISWFEYFLNGSLFVALILSIFWKDFNQLHMDDPYLGWMGLAFLVSWFSNRPIVYDFHRFDYKIDYSASVLFKVISNGLTFIWALVFLGILGFTYVTGERYVSALYNLVFLGIFLCYYYPILYVKTNITK